MIECVPNVSEGRRTAVVERIAGAIRSTADVALLDYSSDPAHHRSVYTMVGSPSSLRMALLALFDEALRHIDLRQHRGVHPRLGAVDVVPFIPLEDASMDECITLAREVGAAIAERFQLPVFLYEAAATTPERRRLEVIRQGQFEGLSEKMRRPEWLPDFGPGHPHPTAGATVVGARGPLIAFNVNLATADLEVAQAIAASIRSSGGGLPSLKAMGVALPDRGHVQVSMNLTDYATTSMVQAFEEVQSHARRLGVDVRDSELVGLVPRAALTVQDAGRLRIRGFTEERILEHRIERLR